MSQIKEQIEEFLAEGGRELGYDEDNFPESKDFLTITLKNIPAWEYFGFKTEKEYYGGNKDG